MLCFFFFFNDTATTEIYTLSLHDALPIYRGKSVDTDIAFNMVRYRHLCIRISYQHISGVDNGRLDRKSTRLNSSHANISYAVFCLKKKNNISNELHLYQLPIHNDHLCIVL